MFALQVRSEDQANHRPISSQNTLCNCALKEKETFLFFFQLWKYYYQADHELLSWAKLEVFLLP